MAHLVESVAPARPPGHRGPPRSRTRRLLRVLVRVLIPAAAAAALLRLALPRVTGVGWAETGEALAGVGWAWVLALGLLWVAGLVLHTVALVAALPGLTTRRALLLNLTGSCVSDLLPLGGAAGTVANYAMCRTWGFGRGDFVRWAVVTNIWDTLLKLVLPAVALAGLALVGRASATGLEGAAVVGAAGLVVGAGVLVGVLRHPSWAVAVGRGLDRAVRVLRRSPVPGGYAARVVALREDTVSLVAAAWGRLTVGKVGYALLQAALLQGCLVAVGAGFEPAVVLAGFAMERVLTMLVLTPGATGFVEVGMAGVLVALGTDPVGATAGVLLYRFYTFALEIPVGGGGLGWWLLRGGPRGGRVHPGAPRSAGAQSR